VLLVPNLFRIRLVCPRSKQCGGVPTPDLLDRLAVGSLRHLALVVCKTVACAVFASHFASDRQNGEPRRNGRDWRSGRAVWSHVECRTGAPHGHHARNANGRFAQNVQRARRAVFWGVRRHVSDAKTRWQGRCLHPKVLGQVCCVCHAMRNEIPRASTRNGARNSQSSRLPAAALIVSSLSPKTDRFRFDDVIHVLIQRRFMTRSFAIYYWAACGNRECDRDGQKQKRRRAIHGQCT
jgi:hypothetical protein